ncbi:hypothetical protein COT95_01400 [Candidatus Falkowbacteria bacterium CG10_big_fil_rev_8_21_14_0_10_37_6]|uniref:Uncharacterized protein n=1 Tax=Candidatus Falkowbacteria bacterium CG10_big_fil_rev_8_21_14_0_10_37_6 TaxID=1974563 RepID=A0A2H0V7B0_9BACT|nr:MAG: hypothetical protein COT95_01400 [Candidatus Falkowbacteria bacterium CG10_big_fil_rev_8_21_14_0_10_37_6]
MKNKMLQKIKEYFKDPLFLSKWVFSYGHKKDGLAERIPENKLGKYVYNGTARMLIEDIYTSIMPFTHVSPKKEGFSIAIDVDDKNKQSLIAGGLSDRSYSVWLDDAVSEFIRMTALSLLNDGVNYYEIITNKSKTGQIEKFDLYSIGSSHIFRWFNNYYQIVPWWIAQKYHLKVGIIKIPKNKILKIKFPKELGGKSRLAKIMKRLWWLGKEFTPSFQMDAMKENKDIGFDLNKYADTKNIEIDKVTTIYGWNHRGYLEKRVLEYYSMKRYLGLKKTQAILRRTILDKINEAINGPELNLNCKVVINGLPDEKTIDEFQQKLSKGDVEFMEIFKATNY